MAGLQISEVSFSYSNGLVLRDVSLTIRLGEMIGLLGPNGSGKTTLIKLASGIFQPGRGSVRLDGLDLVRLSRKAVARSVAVVPQQFNVPFAFTAGEIVLLGRVPFLHGFSGESEADRRAVADALKMVGISGLERRQFDQLSGGERQKVVLAMALAQQPELLLLDEPTVHLDIAHQVEILELVKKLNVERGITIVAALHELNMAALYFSRLVLLKEGRVMADGTPAEVLTEKMISEVYSASVRVEPHPVTGAPHIVIMPGSHTQQG